MGNKSSANYQGFPYWGDGAVPLLMENLPITLTPQPPTFSLQFLF